MNRDASIEAQIDPVLLAGLKELPADLISGIRDDTKAARETMAATMKEMASLIPKGSVGEEQRIIDGPGGDLELTIYRPAGDGPRGAYVNLHGGGYLVGSGDDPLYGYMMANAADCVVVSPDYRLAPEHRAPAAVEDAFAALVWTNDHADELGIDRSRLAIGGASAGGGLAASLAIYNRDQGGPEICFQNLIYPMIDDRHDTPSGHEITHPLLWNRDISLWAWGLYANQGEISPYAAAARVESVEGLPPAYVGVGQLDLFRDESIAYASRLMAAGIPTELCVVPGMFHGGESMVPQAPISEVLRQSYVGALQRALAPRG